MVKVLGKIGMVIFAGMFWLSAVVMCGLMLLIFASMLLANNYVVEWLGWLM